MKKRTRILIAMVPIVVALLLVLGLAQKPAEADDIGPKLIHYGHDDCDACPDWMWIDGMLCPLNECQLWENGASCYYGINCWGPF